MVWRTHRRVPVKALGLLLCCLGAAAPPARAETDPTTKSLEDLLKVGIVGASKYEQKQGEVAAAVSVITRDQIRTFGWRTIGEALASLPGVYTTYDRQYSYFSMRGFGLPGDYNTRVLVTVNGNRLNDPTYDSAPIGSDFPLDVDLIERIEFIPGPGGAVYGQNAMFGVVNIVTRHGAELNGGELTAAAQSPQGLYRGRATAGIQMDNGVELLLSASSMHARGQNLPFDYGSAGVSGIANGMDNERIGQLYARLERGAWSFDVIDSDRVKGDPTGAYLSDPLVPGQYQADGYTVAQLQYQDRFADDSLRVMARLFIGQERYRSMFSYGGIWFSQPTDGHWRGAELQVLTTAIDDHKLMAGAELQDNTDEDQFNINLTNPSQAVVIPGSGRRYGIYAQDEWRIADKLAATLGLRVDQNYVTSTQLSPRAGLIWQAAGETSLKLLYGRANRAPNAFERNYQDGVSQINNPTLNGERIDTLELVGDQRVGPDLALRASLYWWSLHDLITLGVDPVSGLAQYQSGTPVRAHGLELSADKTWALGLRLRGSLSLQEVRREDATPMLNSPRMLGKLNFSGPLPWHGLRFGYEWQYVSPRLSRDGSYLGGYQVSNLQLQAESWLRGLDVRLGVYNLGDRSYADPGAATNWQNALEQDGRSVRLTLTYRF